MGALPLIMLEEAWSGRKPCIAHMGVFGCVACAMVPNEKRGKLNVKGTKCVFLGYCEGQWYMKIDYSSKGLQEYMMQMGVPHQEGCIGSNR